MKIYDKIWIAVFVSAVFLSSGYSREDENPKPMAEDSSVSSSRSYIRVKVNGLACAFCAYGLEKGIKKIKGSENFFADLKKGMVRFEVPSANAPTEGAIKKVVKDAGFEMVGIEVSEKPFPKEGQ